MRTIKTEVARRFQRSIRLDSDFRVKAAIADYVPLPASLGALMRMGEQVANSSQRAFTWTGPYGGGKSSLALLLASLLDIEPTVRKTARDVVPSAAASRIQGAFGVRKGGWLVVPMVGQRESIVKVLDDALTKTLAHRFGSRVPKPLALSSEGSPKNLIDRISRVADYMRGKADGILIIIDEMGRFLEYAAIADGDISFLQELAEIIGRLETKVVIVGVLHQAFEQYASKLGTDTRDEWAKIQGRFVDIPLTTGPEETVRLLSQALVGDKAPKGYNEVCARIASSVKERRAGIADDFDDLLAGCWPLHPVVALLLAAVSRKRFGQNERSTFGFLNSGEPGGFQEFLANASDRNALYDVAAFWDYLRINLEPAIMSSSDGHRWAQAVEAVDRAESKGGRAHVDLVKTIATLDLFGAPVGLYADDKLIRGGLLGPKASEASQLLDDLRSWSIIVLRSHVKSWAVFAGSDFDIDAEVSAAKARVDVEFESLQRILTHQAVIAKKHYYERGTLRWFDVRICALNDVPRLVASYRIDRGACGLFVLAIPSVHERLDIALLQAEQFSLENADYPFFVGISKYAADVRVLTHELAALEYVKANVSALEGDQVARRELAARSTALREQLDQKMSEMLGTAFWCRKGESQELNSLGLLSRLASDCASEVFASAPTIKNELINRTKPSSNAISAANELMRLMVLQSTRAHLGIEGYPPQRAIYDAVLAVPGIHRKDRQSGGAYKFNGPNHSDIGRSFTEMWAEGERFVEETSKERLPLSKLYKRWAQPPFGIRSGVIPIYALALILARESQLAVYLDGHFVPQLDAFFVDRMLQDPGAVELRKFHITGVARSALERLSSMVAERVDGALSLDALSVAKPLVAFVRSLHPWVKKTRTLDRAAIACRDCIIKASDPIALLFEELPRACGLEAISYNAKDEKTLHAYTDALRRAVDDLRAAYPRLLDKLILHVGNRLGDSLLSDKGRFALSERASLVIGRSGDFRLDAFATRLKAASSSIEWAESIGGLAANKPVRDWIDNDIDRAMFEISDLCARFKRVEAVAASLEVPRDAEIVSIVVGGGKEPLAIIQAIETSSAEKLLAREALIELRARLISSGLPADRMLSVVAEIAREIIVTQSAPSENAATDLTTAVEELRKWRN